ncbi:MAG: DNA polymerase III subunit delta' [Desulfovibrio sp.]|jgi:DNA polymerase-3 subunit delta'|nr:DNA polymerase III subunit delta' [Desulfovibrio sp.]
MSYEKNPSENEKNPASSEDLLPDRRNVDEYLLPVRAFMDNGNMFVTRAFLERLAQRPPQVLLLEGGTAEERLAAAHYWIMLLNCDPQNAPKTAPAPIHLERPALFALPGLPSGPADEKKAAPPVTNEKQNQLRPCLQCPSCIRMAAHMHRDCFFFDGVSQSIKIDELRAVKSVLWEPPRDARFRVVLIHEAQALTIASANTLLKVLEEPLRNTSFILLAPQREILLPTLVSRSFVLTLPWPRVGEPNQDERLPAWEAYLCSFLESGQGIFDKSAVKSAVDATLVQSIINACARALIAAILSRQNGETKNAGLGKIFSALPETQLRVLNEILAEGRECLTYGVNPTLALEWIAVRAYFLFPWNSPVFSKLVERGGKFA